MIDWAEPPGNPPTPPEAYRIGWAVMLARARELVPIGLVWALASLPAAASGESVVGFIYNILVLGPVNFGGSYALLRAARGESPEVGDLFLPFRADYVDSVLGSLLISFFVMVGIMLFVVPGIVAMVRLSWVPYLVVEGRRPAIAAVRESWTRTGRYAWTIFAIEALALPVLLVGIFFFIVGVIPALILAHLAAATFYAAIVPRDEAVPEVPGQQP
jgi:hypothetical protein